MKIIEPDFKILFPYQDGVEMLRLVERIARVSHRAEDAQTEDSWMRFIKAVVVDKGDWSVTEHVIITVEARVDRGISHEWVRHRIGSYTQESTRFVNYEKKGEIEVIRPKRLQEKNFQTWRDAVATGCAAYLNLIHNGEKAQDARSVLPHGLATTIISTYNLRSWRQFFMMRTTKETHPDLRRVTIPMLAEFQKIVPLLYDDIVPEEKQSISLSRPR